MKATFNLLLITLFFSSPFVRAQVWEEQAHNLLPANYGIYDLSVVDENVVWAIAIDRTVGAPVPEDHLMKIIKTNDGGENWELIDVDDILGRISFDIQAFDDNTAFISTQDLGSGLGKGIYKTTDGGDTWTASLIDPAGGVWLRFFNTNEGVAINRNFIATTTNGGDTWEFVSPESIPPFLDGEYTGITTGNNSLEMRDDHLWFGTSMGRIFRSKDKGHTWEVFTCSFGAEVSIRSVAFKDSLNGIALNSSGYASFSRTSDGGETWTTITDEPGYLLDAVAYVPGTESSFFAFSGPYVPLWDRVCAYSPDFGITWIAIDSEIGYGATAFISPTLGWTTLGLVSAESEPNMFKWTEAAFLNLETCTNTENLFVYPNPSSNIIQVDLEGLSSDNPVYYELYSSSGQLVGSGTLNSNQSTNLSIAHLEEGLYYLTAVINEKRYEKKLIKLK